MDRKTFRWISIISIVIILVLSVMLRLKNPGLTDTELFIRYWYLYCGSLLYCFLIISINILWDKE